MFYHPMASSSNSYNICKTCCKKGHDVIYNNWVPWGCYNSSLFEIPNIFGETLVKIVKPLFDQFQLLDKVFVYIKDERSNSRTFESVTSCKLLELKKTFCKYMFWPYDGQGLSICNYTR